MRQGETDSSPLWTLEFAVPGNTAVQKSPDPELDESQQREETEEGDEIQEEGDESQREDKNQDRFVLPVPVVKEPPALAIELVRRHLRQMVIVYAVINVEGKMEQMAVMESPDTLLHQPVLEALSQWVFQPGLLNDVPVPVRSLLGIPLWVSVPPG